MEVDRLSLPCMSDTCCPLIPTSDGGPSLQLASPPGWRTLSSPPPLPPIPAQEVRFLSFTHPCAWGAGSALETQLLEKPGLDTTPNPGPQGFHWLHSGPALTG